jgi:hypothetical protein
LAREQPASGKHDTVTPPLLPSGAQNSQQVGREQGVTASAAFAALDEYHLRVVE